MNDEGDARTHLDVFAALARPFEDWEIKTKPQGARPLRFITARTAMNRLDDVLGPAGWWDEYAPGVHSVICKLSIALPDGAVITKSDAGGPAGMQDAGDDEKSAFSDAFKRACVKFGVGRYLYGDGVPEFVLERHPDGPQERPTPSPRAAPRPSKAHPAEAPPPPPKPRDDRPFAKLVEDAVAKCNESFREEHEGAGDALNVFQVHAHLLRTAIEDGHIPEAPGKLNAGKRLAILAGAYEGDGEARRWLRRELAGYLTRQLEAARAEAAAPAEEPGAEPEPADDAEILASEAGARG